VDCARIATRSLSRVFHSQVVVRKRWVGSGCPRHWWNCQCNESHKCFTPQCCGKHERNELDTDVDIRCCRRLSRRRRGKWWSRMGQFVYN